MKSAVRRISRLLAAAILAATLTAQGVPAHSPVPPPGSASGEYGVPPLHAAEQTVPAPAAAPLELEDILKQESLAEAVTAIERHWEESYEDYFKANLAGLPLTAQEIAATLDSIGRKTGTKPALIYLVPGSQQLALVLIAPQRLPVRILVPAAPRERLLEVVQDFGEQIKNPRKLSTTSYLQPAQQLYQWMVAPLESELRAASADTLLFCAGPGLRAMPLAALHDGQQFLVEKYSLARIPAFKLTDTLYTDIRNSRVLAMGASEFQKLSPLPAVPVELSAIVGKLWPGETFLNQAFTLANLQSHLKPQSFGIVHLATHAEFQPGEANKSYIQFWDAKLTLDKMRDLGWKNSPVQLLVLSACRTAIGDKQAELGFAGLAVQSGVKSAVASLWYVSDAGTLALMSEFYRHLKTAPIKAEALRQAQMAMIRGQVPLQRGSLQRPTGSPPQPAAPRLPLENFSHPFYWSAFTIVGSPW
ncbi:CHAT domain-containing protein [Kamptonema formosum]|uniref:CHAT domain-containing protein n=1 Tax=Kamptonema formosum TaxID=331992 RepID=UPI00034D1A54|nr:CHAT domain-containing protein [Oscillatoria sp. PCC 10802]